MDAVDQYLGLCFLLSCRAGLDCLRVGDGYRSAIQLGQRYAELLVVCVGVVLQITQRHRLAKLARRVSITTPVNPGMDAVAEADVVGELVQLAVDGKRRLAWRGGV